MPDERRQVERREFSYYMRVVDGKTGQVVGHLLDIGTIGFKLDCAATIPLNKVYRLRMDLPSDISSKGFIVFSARSRWCRPADLDPTSFNVGFQITEMLPEDFKAFSLLFERYGSQSTSNESQRSADDFLWR